MADELTLDTPLDDTASFGDFLDDEVDDTAADDTAAAATTDENEPISLGEARKLRRESAGYRTQLRRLEQEREEFAGWLRHGLQHDPDALHRQLVDALGVQVTDAIEDEAAATDRPIEEIVQSAIDGAFDERDQRVERVAFDRATNEGRSQIRGLAESLGFKPTAEANTKEGRRYRHLLNVAADEFATDDDGEDRDPMEAVQMAAGALYDELAEHDKSVRASYLKGKDGGVVPVTTGEEAGTEKAPETAADSRRALSSWLDSQ